MVVITAHASNLRKRSAMYNGGIVPPRKGYTWLTKRPEVPRGYHRCLNHLCDQLIPESAFSERFVTCPVGHDFDLQKEFYDLFKPGGKTLAGLTPKDMGDIGEAAVRSLGDLDEYGKIIPTDWDDRYHCPLDFATDMDNGGEIKTLCWLAENHRFFLSKRKYRLAKEAFARKRGFKVILGVLVILNFETSTAEIYIKAMRKTGKEWMHSFVKPETPFAIVAFRNPLESEFKRIAAIKRAMELGQDFSRLLAPVEVELPF